MTFAHPWWLAALVPLVLLALRSRWRSRRVVVPDLWLYRRVLLRSSETSSTPRLWRWTPYLLPAFFLILGLAEPHLRGGAARVVVLDRSAGGGRIEGGETRVARALKAVQQFGTPDRIVGVPLPQPGEEMTSASGRFVSTMELMEEARRQQSSGDEVVVATFRAVEPEVGIGLVAISDRMANGGIAAVASTREGGSGSDARGMSRVVRCASSRCPALSLKKVFVGTSRPPLNLQSQRTPHASSLCRRTPTHRTTSWISGPSANHFGCASPHRRLKRSGKCSPQ